MADRYDALVVREDKNGKSWWTKIGVAFPAKQGDGFTIMLDALPLADSTGQAKIMLRVPKERDGSVRSAPARQAPQGGGSAADDLDDTIPFSPCKD